MLKDLLKNMKTVFFASIVSFWFWITGFLYDNPFKKIGKFFKDVWKGNFIYPDSVGEFYDNSLFWRQIKHPICGVHPFGNFYYLLYGDLDCTCCAFTRGLIIGAIVMLIIL